LSKILVKLFFILMSILAYTNIKRYFRINLPLNSLLSFSLLLYGASNIFALVPSGGRYIFLSQMFMLFTLVLLFICDSPLSKYKKYFPLSLMLLYPVIFNIRIAFEYYGISLFLGNFLTSFFWYDNIPLIDFIK